MASQPVSALTTVTPKATMLIPVVDPSQPTGLKNGNVTIEALLNGLAPPTDGYAAVRIEVPEYASMQAALTASLAVPDAAYVYAPSGNYVETGPISLTLGGYSLTVDGDSDATFTFPAGDNGFSFTNGATDLVALKFKNAVIVTEATGAPAGTGLAVNNPLFVSGNFTDQTYLANLRFTGDWAVALSIAGAPQGIVENVVVQFPYGNTTSIAFNLVGNGADGIATNYILRNFGVVDAGGTAFNVGANIQGLVLDNCFCFEQQFGIVWNNPTTAGDLLQLIGGNYDAAQALNVTGASGAILYNIIMDGTYFYGPPASSGAFWSLNYCWYGYITGVNVNPSSPAPWQVLNSQYLTFVGGSINASSMTFTGSKDIVLSAMRINAATVSGGAGPIVYDAINWTSATVFSGGYQDLIKNCKFDSLPDFTAAGYNPILKNNWFAGQFWESGAPASILSAAYLDVSQKLQTVEPAKYAQFAGGAGGAVQIIALIGNLLVDTANPVAITMPAAPALPSLYMQDQVVTFALANPNVTWVLGTGTQSFIGPALPNSVAAGQEVRLRWIQFLNAYLNVTPQIPNLGAALTLNSGSMTFNEPAVFDSTYGVASFPVTVRPAGSGPVDAGTATNSNVLNFGVGNIPAACVANAQVSDLTNSGAIPAGTVVTHVNAGAGTVTISAFPAAAVGATDNIHFDSTVQVIPNGVGVLYMVPAGGQTSVTIIAPSALPADNRFCVAAQSALNVTWQVAGTATGYVGAPASVGPAAPVEFQLIGTSLVAV